MATNELTIPMHAHDTPNPGDCMEADPVSLHLAEFVEKASPIATKAAIGTSVATGATGAASSVLALPDIVAVVGMVCSVAATTAAITFGYLNYQINKKRGGR